MNAEMWNGAFIGAGIVALVVAIVVATVAVVGALKLGKHLVQLYRRTATVDFGQDADGSHKVMFSTRERFKEGVSVDPRAFGDRFSLADSLADLEGTRTARGRGSSPPKNSGEQ